MRFEQYQSYVVMLVLTLVLLSAMSGIGNALAIILAVGLMSLPVYAILSSLRQVDVPQLDLAVLSMFLGVGILPSLVFVISRMIGERFRLSVVIASVILIGTAVLFRRSRK